MFVACALESPLETWELAMLAQNVLPKVELWMEIVLQVLVYAAHLRKQLFLNVIIDLSNLNCIHLSGCLVVVHPSLITEHTLPTHHIPVHTLRPAPRAVPTL